MTTLSIVIPAYDEERTIGALLEKIRALDLTPLGVGKEVIVVDDGSRDRTAEIAASFAGVVLVRMPRNGGKGRALRAGIARATGELLVIQDADLEYEPEDYLPMLAALREAGVDAVYGSRYLREPGGGGLRGFAAGRHPGQGWASYLGGRSLSWIAWLCTGARLSDTVTALKLFRSELLRPLELETRGFETDHEITARLVAAGARIREVPVRYRPRSRAEGKKMRPRDWLVAVRTFLRYGHRVPSREDLKNLAMQQQWILDLHARFVFPRTVPPSERSDSEKQALLRAVKPYTLLHYPRLSALHDAARGLDAAGVPGCIVECGVWNGGSAGLLARAAAGRRLWLFDSWQGAPAPTARDVSARGSRGRRRMFLGSRAKVEALLFERLGVEPSRVRLEPGWFEATLSRRRAEIGPIALLHLDCDWYASVKLCLETLYDAVVPGGFVFIDDYGYWCGCRQAVDEFLAARRLQARLAPIDASGACLRKP